MFSSPPASLDNGASWQIELLRDDSTRLEILDTVGPFQITSTVNNWGNFSLVLPQGFDKTLLAIDRRVRFWRRPASGTQYVEFEGLIRTLRTEGDANGNIQRTIGGPSLEYVLSSRVIVAATGSTGSDKTGAIDDLMKAYVTEQLGASASAARALSAAQFTVQGNATLGTSTTKTGSYRNLLDILRELSNAARQAGTEIYFSIVPTPPSFEFRTSVGQPGADRTGAGNQLVFGMSRGNLKNPVLSEDWMDEANYVYALGPGSAGRTITTASAARGTNSLFALRETSTSAQATGATETAQAAVTAARPALTFTGELQSVAPTIYGKNWEFGDRVNIDFDDRQFPALVRSVTISVDAQGQEQIPAMAEAYL